MYSVFRTLKEILQHGLEVIAADSDNRRISSEQILLPLRTSIDKFQGIMKAFQSHEAREIMCLTLTKDVKRLVELKSELER